MERVLGFCDGSTYALTPQQIYFKMRVTYAT